MAQARYLWISSVLALSGLACGGGGTAAGQGGRDWDAERTRMVDQQLRARDIGSARVLDAMLKVPRHVFVPESQRANAYGDFPLPIGHEQTISQPYMVARICEILGLTGRERVLDVGTGSGYQAAVLAELAREVYTIEIIPELAEGARRVLTELGYKNVFVRTGNGYLGWPEQAPFDAIVVTAAPDEIPQALVSQLAVGGRMVIPVGKGDQEMVIVEKTSKGVTKKTTIPVRFVPMTGKPTP